MGGAGGTAPAAGLATARATAVTPCSTGAAESSAGLEAATGWRPALTGEDRSLTSSAGALEPRAPLRLGWVPAVFFSSCATALSAFSAIAFAADRALFAFATTEAFGASFFAAALRTAAFDASCLAGRFFEEAFFVAAAAAGALAGLVPAFAPLFAAAFFAAAVLLSAGTSSALRRRDAAGATGEDSAGCRPRAPDSPFAAATFTAAALRMSFAERVLLDVDRATGSLVRALSEAVGSYSLSAPMRQDDHRSERPSPGIFRRVAVAPIRAYRMLLSPWLGQSCRFHPSCSRYAEEAILRFGLLRGGILMFWRLLRCQPLCAGGEDPVPDRFVLSRLPGCRADSSREAPG